MNTDELSGMQYFIFNMLQRFTNQGFTSIHKMDIGIIAFGFETDDVDNLFENDSIHSWQGQFAPESGLSTLLSEDGNVTNL